MEGGGIIISGVQSQVLILIGHSQIASFHRKIKYHNLIDRPLVVCIIHTHAFDFGRHLQWDCIKSFKLQPLLLLLKWTDDPDLFAIGRDFFNNRCTHISPA
jgi:hypothetical protein